MDFVAPFGGANLRDCVTPTSYRASKLTRVRQKAQMDSEDSDELLIKHTVEITDNAMNQLTAVFSFTFTNLISK